MSVCALIIGRCFKGVMYKGLTYVNLIPNCFRCAISAAIKRQYNIFSPTHKNSTQRNTNMPGPTMTAAETEEWETRQVLAFENGEMGWVFNQESDEVGILRGLITQ
jgi:F0F1-type ATP synthase alpha subunit